MTLPKAIITAGILMLAISCAWVEVEPIRGDEANTMGFRFYESKPILVVTDSNTQIVFVPNYSRAYAVRFGAFLAKHDLTLETDGVFLKKVVSTQDPAEIIKGLIAVSRDVLKEAAKVGATAASEPVSGRVIAVYDFVFDEDGNIRELNKLELGIPPSTISD